MSITSTRRVWVTKPRANGQPTQDDLDNAATNNAPEIQQSPEVDVDGVLVEEIYVRKEFTPSGSELLKYGEADIIISPQASGDEDLFITWDIKKKSYFVIPTGQVAGQVIEAMIKNIRETGSRKVVFSATSVPEDGDLEVTVPIEKTLYVKLLDNGEIFQVVASEIL